MSMYTITHPAEALSVLTIDPMDWRDRDRLIVGLTDDKAAKEYTKVYVVERDRATGAIVAATAEEDTAYLSRMHRYGIIDEAGRALLAEVIAGDKFATSHFAKVS